MKKLKIYVIATMILVCAAVCSGCGKDDETNKIEFFGPELYNTSYVKIPNDDVVIAIPVMSKIDLMQYEGYGIECQGGDINSYDFTVEKIDYEIDDYRFYNVVLEVHDAEFEGSRINISKVTVILQDEQEIVLEPDKCEIVEPEGVYNADYININGAPLRMPSDMTSLPLEISAEEDVTVTNIYITNTSLKLAEESDNSFEEFTIKKSSGQVNWNAIFGIENSDLTEYKQYGTSIIVEYEYDGEKYYTTPAIPRTIYNPFHPDYEEAIENYYKLLNE